MHYIIIIIIIPFIKNTGSLTKQIWKLALVVRQLTMKNSLVIRWRMHPYFVILGV